jgi:hypothetical protein
MGARMAVPQRARLPVCIAAAAMALLPGRAPAQEMKNFISNLYGGNGILLAPVLDQFGFSHQPHFLATSLQVLQGLDTSIVSGLQQSSFGSAVAGFTYDISQGLPIRKEESLGPVVAERAQTLGANRLNLAMSYSHVDFTQFQGQSLDNFPVTLQHIDVNQDAALGPVGTPLDFELDQIQLKLKISVTQDVFAFFGTYGVTDRWDVGVVLPIVHTDVRAVADATIVARAVANPGLHVFGPTSPHSESGGDATGIGDIALRTKYNFVRDAGNVPDMAFFGQVKLPTGSQSDLLGSGSTNILGLFIASKTYGAFTPHVNLGYEVAIAGFDRSNFRYAAGTDYSVTRDVALSGDFVGRWRTDAADIGANTTDFALGGKWRPFGKDAVVSGAFLVPVNKDTGLRPDYAVLFGVDFTF